MAFVDDAARRRALTELESTFLVEAAAGTGKTSLMAGRLVMLLAAGTAPATIAAITFTELAASELAARVRRFVSALLAGQVPEDLKLALPNGLSAAQRAALATAENRLDELTATTIHGFSQEIIRAYAIEADVDPGARVLAADEAEGAFSLVFDHWFHDRLGAPAFPGDPIAALSKESPRTIRNTLHDLAQLHRSHRGAMVPGSGLSDDAERDLVQSILGFRDWLDGAPEEPETERTVSELEKLAMFYGNGFSNAPDFPRLWHLAHPPRLSIMRKGSHDLLPYKRRTAWAEVASKSDAARLNDEASALYERATATFRELLGRIATELIFTLSKELGEVQANYAAFKRTAALLDFDDLLHKARDLVRTNDTVRAALGKKYEWIFVDEFQDTDPMQAEIVFLIAAEAMPRRWQDVVLRRGSLFAVGDPKQAIYQFRGAEIATYLEARSVIERCFPGHCLHVTSSFRSRPAVLEYVNSIFEAPLNAVGQPGYVKLSPTIEKSKDLLPNVTKITIDLAPDSKADELREAEAAAVADVCQRLVGSLTVRSSDEGSVLLRPGHIALLAPTGRDLWRYERALEERGLPIASQAGKGLFRRQEIQELIAIVRVLADARDTIALGALLRGPLVGLTEDDLLDLAYALPEGQRLTVSTPPELIAHPIAHEVLSILVDLRRRSRSTTPFQILSEAMEKLNIRPILAARAGGRSSRALANADMLLERARQYGVRGLKTFARDLHRDWLDGAQHGEGRVDPEGHAIELVTVHSSKGLEWPVVIPINCATRPRSRGQFVYRQSDNTLHWVLGDVVPPGLADALAAEESSLARERARLWYVACTRAMEYLILPHITIASDRSWARIVDLTHRNLPEFDQKLLQTATSVAVSEEPNGQSLETFRDESARLKQASPKISWRRPSDHDSDRLEAIPATPVVNDDITELLLPPGAGRVRGLILHKIMEEVLAGVLDDTRSALAARAQTLVAELAVEARDGESSPLPDEIATTVLRTLSLPDVSVVRATLIPEYPIYQDVSRPGERATILLAGRADAVVLEEDRITAIFDWKSDVNPSQQIRRVYSLQLKDYLQALAVRRGAIVYMSRAEVDWIECG